MIPDERTQMPQRRGEQKKVNMWMCQNGYQMHKTIMLLSYWLWLL